MPRFTNYYQTIIMEKQPYLQPEILQIKVDNEISVVLMSSSTDINPPALPDPPPIQS